MAPVLAPLVFGEILTRFSFMVPILIPSALLFSKHPTFLPPTSIKRAWSFQAQIHGIIWQITLGALKLMPSALQKA